MTKIDCVGAGGVGSCFIDQLDYLARRQTGPKIRLIYIAIIDKALYHNDYVAINIENAPETLESDGFEPPTISQIVAYLSLAPGRVVVIDNTSSEQIADSYPDFLKKGISIVTPNKKAFSGSYELWKEIFASAASSNSFIYHESSVGAGMPIISTLNDMVQTGDEILRIEGVFSGTMSYLFNNFSPADGSGRGTWSEAVQKAKALGYTEPDPRDDLNGLDVARKLTILGRIAGLPIDSPSSFPVQSLIPKELDRAISTEEFLRRLPDFDEHMEAEKAAAASVGKVVRFVGKVDLTTGHASVGLEQFDKSHPIANLQGSDNIINFHTKRYDVLPLTIRGAGAGGEVTAMGVSSDLLRILSQIR